MKNKLLILSLYSTATLANLYAPQAHADGYPIQTQVESQPIGDPSIVPAFISVKTMANATIHYSTGNERLTVVVSGASAPKNASLTQAEEKKEEEKLQSFLNPKVKFRRDRGIEIGVKESGIYHCSYETENGSLASVSGSCIFDIKINFAKDQVVPLYVNGNLQQLN